MAEKPDNHDDASGNGSDTSDVDEVANETKDVFKHFVYRRLTSQIDKEAEEGELMVANIPPSVMNELKTEGEADEEQKGCDEVRKKKINQLGKTLADFGDEIQAQYHETFLGMVSSLNINDDESFAFESFRRVAKRLFENGISWGRIIALLCFGYEIAAHVIKRGARGIVRFLRKIIHYIVEFIVKEKIASWIANRGGWTSASIDMTNMTDNYVFLRFAAVVALFCVGSYGIFKYFTADKS